MAWKKVVVDASALISLARADFLRYPITNFELVVPHSAVEEIEALRERPETEAAANKVLEVKSKLTAIEPGESATGQDRGEKDCFSICIEEGIKLFVLDDFRAIRKMKPAAASRGVNLLLSAFFIAHAAGGEKISEDEAFDVLDRMAERFSSAFNYLLVKLLLNGECIFVGQLPRKFSVHFLIRSTSLQYSRNNPS